MWTNKLLILFLSVASGSAWGANHYILDGGSGDGSSWSSAWDDLPGTLVRGDTYYLGDGTYGSWTLDDNRNGTNYIYIKKATAADHGTETGWSSAYGDGIATIGPINFDRPPSGSGGYYDINGYSTNGTLNCGIKISNGAVNTTLVNYGIYDTGHHPYCNYRYLELAGPYGTGDFNAGGQPWSYGMYLHGNSSAYDTSYTLVSHCYIHGVTTHFQDNNGNNYMTVEYCTIADSRNSDGIDHGNVWWVASSYSTFRYNLVRNYNTEGLYFGGSTTDFKIYGNVFFSGNGQGTIGYNRGVEFRVTQTGTKIYNNTFVNMEIAAVRVMSDAGACSGVEIYNNIMYNASISLENGGAGITLANNTTLGSTNDFVDYAGDDYRLVAATSAGTTLAPPFDYDMDGLLRGDDGVWDLGAYEYDADAGSAPPTITSGDATGTNGVAFEYAITATEGPKEYGAANLPAGLTVSTNTGLITGTPTETVTNSVTLAVTNAVAGTNKVVTFTIWPPQPALSISPAGLAFGLLPTNSTSDLVLGVTNVGTGTLNGWATNVSAPFSIIGATNYSLATGTGTNITVRYSPTAVGTHQDTITFAGDTVSTNSLLGYAYPVTTLGASFTTEGALLIFPMVSNSAGGQMFITQEADTGDGPTDGGRAVFGVSATSNTTVRVKVTGIATNASNDSFFAGMNAAPGSLDIWDVIPWLTNWQTGYIHVRGVGTSTSPQYPTNTYALTNGVNVFNLYGREANARVQTVEFEYTTESAPDGEGVYYVNSATGDDANDGSSGSPWQGFTNSLDRMDDGNTLVCSGSWTLGASYTSLKTGITVRNGGSATLTILPKRGSGTLLFSGVVDFSGFTINESGSITGEGDGLIGVAGDGSFIHDLIIEDIAAQNDGDEVVFVVSADSCTFSNLTFRNIDDQDLFRAWGVGNLWTSCTFTNCDNPNGGGNAHADMWQTWWVGSPVWSNVIERCYFVNSDQATFQLKGTPDNVVCHPGEEGYWTIRNNIFNACVAWPVISTDNFRFFNNLLYNSGTGTGPTFIIEELCMTNAHFYNNVYVDCTNERGDNPLNGYNAFTDGTLNYGGPGDFTTTEAACKFVNAAAGNFRVQSGSSLIGTATNLLNHGNMTLVDSDGYLRPTSGSWTAGPYEYQSPPTGSTINVNNLFITDEP